MGKVGCIVFSLIFATFAVPGNAKAKVPAIYVFGDSLADVGNNNYLTTENVQKANYSPYGIDFPRKRPSGRFSNGYNGIDFLAIHMGFRRSPPPYLALTNHQTWKGLHGVNFASGSSGLLDSTGINMSVSMTKQIHYFTKFRSDLTTRMGTKAATYLLSKSIFIITSGGNDIFALFAKYNSPNNSGNAEITRTLIYKYNEHIEVVSVLLTHSHSHYMLPLLKDEFLHVMYQLLYNLGARKFLLWGMGPTGCCPYARTLNSSGGCIDVLNDLSMDFNKALEVLMSNLSMTLREMKYSIGNTYAFMSTINANPNYHGYTEIKNACCGYGKLNAQVRCNQNTTYCDDRNHYLFWDTMHPSEATSKKFAMAVYSGHPQFSYPISPIHLINS